MLHCEWTYLNRSANSIVRDYVVVLPLIDQSQSLPIKPVIPVNQPHKPLLITYIAPLLLMYNPNEQKITQQSVPASLSLPQSSYSTPAPTVSHRQASSPLGDSWEVINRLDVPRATNHNPEPSSFFARFTSLFSR